MKATRGNKRYTEAELISVLQDAPTIDEVQRVSGSARHHAYFDVRTVMRGYQNAEPLWAAHNASPRTSRAKRWYCEAIRREFRHRPLSATSPASS
jgi:hypothetical protein